MPRFMTIWLPRWPVQRRLLAWPEWRAVPVFVCRRERRGVLTVVSWAWARPPRDRAPRPGGAARIEPGMPLAEAMAVLAVARGSHACHVARVEHDDPAADAAALDELARWCRRFSPTVGIEPVAPAARRDAVAAPECIRLDVTGTAGFFGGEAALARTAVWTLAARGLHARAAIADTFAAAWAAAHHTDLVEAVVPGGRPPEPSGRRRRWAVVPPGAAASMLAGLPVSALRLEEDAIGTLREVGIETLGGVLRLSARSLASRFPPQVSRRLAQFTGALAEPAAPPGGAELPQADRDFDVPVSTGDAVEGIVCAEVERLLGACLAPLVARGMGVQALQVRLGGVASAPASCAAPTVIDVGLFRPSASVRHLAELVRLRLGRAHLPAEIAGVALEVVAAGPIACRQRVLFTDAAARGGGGLDAAEQAAEAGMLLDRLAGRLGRAAVFEPRAVADAQPEHAWIAAPPGTVAAPARAGAPGRGTGHDVAHAGRSRVPAGRRPVWMPARPLRLDLPRAALVAVAPDGPPVRLRIGATWHTIVAAQGPERIETAWWRGPTVRRDYYVAETDTGERFWVFRRLRDGAWFLHGTFA